MNKPAPTELAAKVASCVNSHSALYLVTLLSKTKPDPALAPLLCDVCHAEYSRCSLDKSHPFTLD